MPEDAVISDPARPGATIVDFLSDGSLAGACEALSRLCGVPIALADPGGRRIVRGPGGWTTAEPVETGGRAVPLLVDGHAIGAIVVGPGEPRIDGAARRCLEEAVAMMAATAGDFCRQELALRAHVKEVTALSRLTALLARATKIDSVLQIALDSALDVLGLDAGSIVLFGQEEGVRTEDEEDLVLKASRNLSREWLECPLPVSKNRLFDRLALRGELVVSEDLLHDDRVLIRDLVEKEGVRAFLNCALLFHDKPIGVIRLYARSPRSFTETDRRLLRSIAEQAAVAVEQARLLLVREHDERMQRQLGLAADVQRRMLPRRMPALPRLDVAARYEPSAELGGDFYDLFELGPNLGVAIGDVVGKGIAAALLMSAVRASLRAHVQDLYHLDEVVTRVNTALCRDTRENEFATLWYGVIDHEKLRLTYCSAGHDPPFVLRGRRRIEELGVGGMVVGVDPSQRYERGTFDLQPGDVLVAYTLDFSGSKFGKDRLRRAVRTILDQAPDAPAARIVEHLFWELRQFAGLLQRPDDQTVVVVRVR
jgi:sigma-B regulation protein RsbU (phosphoserine phosphatase)